MAQILLNDVHCMTRIQEEQKPDYAKVQNLMRSTLARLRIDSQHGGTIWTGQPESLKRPVMMSQRVFSIAVPLLATLTWASTVSAATIIVTDKAAWETQILDLTHAFNTENFDDSTLNSELSYSTGAGGVYEPNIGAGDDDGRWKDLVAKPKGPFVELTTTFEISGGSYGIGGNWDLSPAGHGSHIEITLLDAAGLEIASHEIPYLEGEFWGVISDQKFSGVKLASYDGANDRTQETYYLEDMVYSRGDIMAAATAVPLPAAFWLFTSSLLGLVGIGRWRGGTSMTPPKAT
ncbi:hypothetical protein [Thiorhodococcus fuscus]|uniref:Uncharacterized protein n=1 Tax=Thiorhodococcus fuscus TaxID=527200 RepID=A0ABW4Y2W5_9GAMM